MVIACSPVKIISEDPGVFIPLMVLVGFGMPFKQSEVNVSRDDSCIKTKARRWEGVIG